MTKRTTKDKKLLYTISKSDLDYIAERYMYHFKESAQKQLDSRQFHIACYLRAFGDMIAKVEPSVIFDLEQAPSFPFDDDRIG